LIARVNRGRAKSIGNSEHLTVWEQRSEQGNRGPRSITIEQRMPLDPEGFGGSSGSEPARPVERRNHARRLVNVLALLHLPAEARAFA